MTKTLLKQAQTQVGDDAKVSGLKKEAFPLVEMGQYAQADKLLQEAFDLELSAARHAQDAANRAQHEADRNFFDFAM
jgi:hypothetical protein